MDQSVQAAPAAKNLPPRTTGWPLVGSLPRLIRQKQDFWLPMRARYGDIYTLDLGVTEVVILNHPRHADHIFRRHADNYPEKGGSRGFRASVLASIRNGLATLNAEDAFWQQQRRVIQPYFRRPYLEPMAEQMVQVIETELATWARVAGQPQPFDIMPTMARIAVNGTTKAVLGVEPDSHSADRLSQSFRYVLDYIWWGMIGTALPTWLPLPGLQQHRQAVATINQISQQIIARRRESAMADDLLMALLSISAAASAPQITPEQLLDEVVSLLVAGLEPVTGALSWALHLLTQHPEKLQTLQTEIDTVLGQRRPTYADLPQLPYARMVLKESLRLCSPIYQIQRQAREDDEIDGYCIPAGTVVAALLYAIHHHPEVWEKPAHFAPERFATEQEQRERYAWLPFGAGRRVCVAQEFSLMLGQLTLARLLQQYQVRAAPTRPARLFLSTGIRPQAGVWVHLEKRR